jgi:uncharacterized membrane protein (DUF373 family)
MDFSHVRLSMNRLSRQIMEFDDNQITDLWSKAIKGVLSLLIFTILVALAAGVLKTFLDIELLLHASVDIGLRQVIVDTLILLAVVEVFKTTLTYLSEGRVKVTFIVDTIIVVMLTEIISVWFKDADQHKLFLLGGILLTLGTMRVVAVTYSPAVERSSEPSTARLSKHERAHVS